MPVPRRLSPTGRRFRRLSATGLAGVPAAVLPLPYLDEVIAEGKIELSVQGHGHRHIGEESTQARHILYSPYLILIRLYYNPIANDTRDAATC